MKYALICVVLVICSCASAPAGNPDNAWAEHNRQIASAVTEVGRAEDLVERSAEITSDIANRIADAVAEIRRAENLIGRSASIADDISSGIAAIIRDFELYEHRVQQLITALREAGYDIEN